MEIIWWKKIVFILLVTLIAIACIGFMWGGFMALVISIIIAIIGYFTNSAVALTVALLVATISAIYKFGLIDIIRKIKK